MTPVEDRYWIFKTPQTEAEAVREIYGYLQNEEITTVGIITSTSGYGQGGYDYLKSEAAAYDITVVEEEFFDDGDLSMSSQVGKILDSSAQAVICWGTDKESAQVAQDMKTQNAEIDLYCSHGVANRDFIVNGGAAVEGVIIPAGKLLAADEIPEEDPQYQVLNQYKSDYEAKYGEGSVDTFGGHAYDALGMIVIALKELAAHEEDLEEPLSVTEAREFIRDAIENIKGFAGTGGVYNMSADNHLGMEPGSLLMYEIVDADWRWLK